METWLVFLAYVAPMVLGMQVASDDMQRITEAQAVMVEQQLMIEEERRIEEQYQEDLHETMTEWFITRLEWLDWIKYTLWRFDVKTNKFDCVWLFKAYAIMRWLRTEKEAGYVNSYVMSHIWETKSLKDAKRGDVTFRKPLWDDYRHIAMVTKEYDPSEWWLWIIDNLWSKPEHRFIRLHNWVYLGRRKVTVHSSPFVELANKKWLKYKPLWSYEGMFDFTRYYSPMPDQERYFLWRTYEQDLYENTQWDPLVTSAWVRLHPWLVERVVACPKNYPLWTKFRVEDRFEVTCIDRGGAIEWKRMDIRAWIWMEWLTNMEQWKVITSRRNVYKYNLHSKPLNETTILFTVIDSFGNYRYVDIPSQEWEQWTEM